MWPENHPNAPASRDQNVSITRVRRFCLLLSSFCFATSASRPLLRDLCFVTSAS